jgi:hypothetical protein
MKIRMRMVVRFPEYKVSGILFVPNEMNSGWYFNYILKR